MPTYYNSSSKTVGAEYFQIPPYTNQPVMKYISLNEFPQLKKISDDPLINNDFQIIFTNISNNTNSTPIFTLNRRRVFRIDNSISENSVDDQVKIQIFIGVNDNINEFIPFKEFTFICKQYKNQYGDSILLWQPQSTFYIDPVWIDMTVEFFCFQVSYIDIAGSINVLMK